MSFTFTSIRTRMPCFVKAKILKITNSYHFLSFCFPSVSLVDLHRCTWCIVRCACRVPRFAAWCSAVLCSPLPSLRFRVLSQFAFLPLLRVSAGSFECDSLSFKTLCPNALCKKTLFESLFCFCYAKKSMQ